MMKYLKKHYHWVVAVLVFLEMIVFGGLINSANVFTLPISNGLGVSTTAYALAMIPYTVTCFIGTCLSGFLFTRFGYKKVAIVSLLIVAGSLVVTAYCQNLLVFSISKILFGMGYGACFTAGSVRIVKDWFLKHQGLVLGAVSMATGLGGSLMTVVLSGLIQSSGWRNANLVAAGIVVITAVLYLFLKDRPDQLRLRPFGFGATMNTTKKARQGSHDWPGFPMSEQLRRPSFYLMVFCVLASCVCIYTTSSFVVPHFTSQGFTADEAAMYQSVYMLALAGVKLVCGFMYDRFGSRPVMVVCMLCGAAGQALLGYSNDPTLSMVAMILFSAGLCMTSIMIPLVAAPIFGFKACLSLNGIFLGLSSFSTIISNPIASMCYDTYGVYSPVYRVTSVALVGITGLYLLLYALAKRDRKRYYRLHPEGQ